MTALIKAKFIFAFCIFLSAWKNADLHWLTQQHDNYVFHFTEADANNVSVYIAMLDKGMQSVTKFFTSGFQKKFDAFIYPTRKDLDSQLQKEWNMPQFKSECWMVASGILPQTGYDLSCNMENRSL